MSLTNSQQQAIEAQGNVLVIAGAGTGKTRTLVDRCLMCLLEEKPPASFEEILLVTFTEAAAAEMRQRIRASLEKILEEVADSSRVRELLALFETAQIGTIHSFCLRLIRQHFYELELDPQLAVLSPEEARLLADETLDELLNRYYADDGPESKNVQELIQVHGRGSDTVIRALVLRVHEYSQTLPDPSGWFSRQLSIFNTAEPTVWREWFAGAVLDWRGRWQSRLAQMPVENAIAQECARAIECLNLPGATNAALVEAFAAIAVLVEGCPRGKKGAWVDPLEVFLQEAQFLQTLVPHGKTDPLAEDWGWVRAQMKVFLELAQQFTAGFSEAKRELGVVDFHDLEQHALRLLWDPATSSPKPIAEEWRRRLRFVFVDEYQDINAAQDKIIECVSRQGADSNRFLVGDLKQSIYRFRLADPAIFQDYAQRWTGAEGRTIPLVENFRSRESVLDFINSVFQLLMRREVGGVEYDESAALRFGALTERSALSASATGPAVELNLLPKRRVGSSSATGETPESSDDFQDLLDAEKEARLLALRLKALKAASHPVLENGESRPMNWRDVAVLLRSPANKAESYAKEFAREGIPLIVARAGFYDSQEVSDILSLLQLLDNPLQDLPLIAVLRSPLVGLSLADLGDVRLAGKGRFWLALNRWHEAHQARMNRGFDGGGNSGGSESPPVGDTFERIHLFLGRFRRWRRLARQAALSRCLEAVLGESHYAAWLLTQPRGEQCHTNILRLVDLARQFDRFQRQSLFRFLRFVEAQQQAQTEPEIAAAADEDAVRLLSIHQSKGLEFPIVALADLGKPFNLTDLRADLVLDEAFGPCPLVKPPQTGRRYPSLPYWLARQRQTRELLGEEMRLLYVAMTRARDLLLLSGFISERRFFPENLETAPPSVDAILEVRCYADWLGLWFTRAVAPPVGQRGGATALLRWQLHSDEALSLASTAVSAEVSAPRGGLPEEMVPHLLEVLDWSYPFQAATLQPAKGSVTAIRHQLSEDEGAAPFSGGKAPWRRPAGTRALQTAVSQRSAPGPRKASAAEIGSANHSFLQLMGLDSGASVSELKQDAARLEAAGALTTQQVALLDFDGVAKFWASALGRRIRGQSGQVRRELAFTARFSTSELAALSGKAVEAGVSEEFVVIQGVADLVVVLEDQLWLVDFKTDDITRAELDGRVSEYRPQIELYAQALSRIYSRPVLESCLYFLALGEQVNLQVPVSG
jgi:ATP-dependent helicase/nuclease subunit A